MHQQVERLHKADELQKAEKAISIEKSLAILPDINLITLPVEDPLGKSFSEPQNKTRPMSEWLQDQATCSQEANGIRNHSHSRLRNRLFAEKSLQSSTEQNHSSQIRSVLSLLGDSSR